MTTCEICHGVGYVIGRTGETASAELCKCQLDAKGAGELYVIERDADGYEVARPAEPYHLVRRVRLFNEAQLPASYGAKTIANFRAEKHNRVLKTRMARYLKQFDLKGSEGLLLAGAPGTGKTHLLCAVLQYLTLQRGIPCRFVDFFDLTVKVRASYDRGSDLSETQIIEPLVEVPVLAIDELGKGRSTHYERTIVDQLISRRYNAGRIVLATTNYLPEALLEPTTTAPAPGPGGERSLPSLEERIGLRIYSRLSEMCEVLRTEGPDYRPRLKRVR